MFLSKFAGRGAIPAPATQSMQASVDETTTQDAGSDDTGSRENLRGILAMLAAMFLFVTNDTLIKVASETLSTPQIIFVRGSIAVVLVAIFAWMTGAFRRWPRRGWRIIGWRSVGEVGSTLLYLTALFHMPIANATAIMQAMPLVMTVLSALVLGEIVRWRRWLAVMGGFVGMLLVVQPGSAGFDVYALVAVASLAFAALRDMSSRYLPAEVPSLIVALVAMFSVTAVGGLWSLTVPWTPIPGAVLAYLAVAAALLSGAFYFVTEAMRHGEVSVVTPFRYSIIITAIALGYLVWGQLPNLLAMAGIVLIVGSGLYVFYRERRVHSSGRPAIESARKSANQ